MRHRKAARTRRVVTSERAFGDKTARGEAQFLGMSLNGVI